jgi:hypothetical protein
MANNKPEKSGGSQDTRFKPGVSGNPKGKPPGPSPRTLIARDAIARFVDANTGRLQGWLDEIAEAKGPDVAFRCVTDLLEYHVPKLARTELVGDGGGPVRIVASTVDEAL